MPFSLTKGCSGRRSRRTPALILTQCHGALVALCLTLAVHPAAASNRSTRQTAGVLLAILGCFSLMGMALGCLVYRQRRARRQARLRARDYADAQELALETQLGDQQPGAEPGAGPSRSPQRQVSRLTRTGPVPREAREADANADAEAYSSGGSSGSGLDERDREGGQANGTTAEAVTISGVPIVNRVRPRNRPPKGTVIVRHEQHQIRINFNALPEIPVAEPPPLTAEELRRLEEEQNRVASPEFYGRADYLERRPSAPASPVFYAGSFASAVPLGNYLSVGGGSQYAGSSASVASMSLRGGSPGLNTPRGGGSLRGAIARHTALGPRQGSYADLLGHAAGAVGGGGYASSHDGRRSTHSGTASGSGGTGQQQRQQQQQQQQQPQQQQQHKGHRRAGQWTVGSAESTDSLESTSDDFDDEVTTGGRAAAAGGHPRTHARHGQHQQQQLPHVRHRRDSAHVHHPGAPLTGGVTPIHGAWPATMAEAGVGPLSVSDAPPPPSPSVFGQSGTALAGSGGGVTGGSHEAPVGGPSPPYTTTAVTAVTAAAHVDVSSSMPIPPTPDLSPARQRILRAMEGSTVSSRSSSASIRVPFPRAHPAASPPPSTAAVAPPVAFVSLHSSSPPAGSERGQPTGVVPFPFPHPTGGHGGPAGSTPAAGRLESPLDAFFGSAPTAVGGGEGGGGGGGGSVTTL